MWQHRCAREGIEVKIRQHPTTRLLRISGEIHTLDLRKGLEPLLSVSRSQAYPCHFLHNLLTVADHHKVEKVHNRGGVCAEGATCNYDGVGIATLGCKKRYARH